MSALRQPDLERPPSTPATSRRYQSAGYRAKKLLLGPALKTSQLVHELVHERVSKRSRWPCSPPTRSLRPPMPPRRSCSCWSGPGLTRVLRSMENVNVTIVPFHLRSQPQLFSVKET